ncbi:MAG TPA: hypothetical protein VMS98_20120 [Thermoanaerobaculia bacterium]|nr:hypothetical protein [Thermoanaerobaculia bacterium]
MKKTFFVVLIAAAVAATLFAATQQGEPVRAPQTSPLMGQTQAQADEKSSGCLSCHEGIEPMHASAAVKLGCTDCHGGNAGVMASRIDDEDAKNRAHILPRNKEIWKTSRNPVGTYTALLKESAEFVKFMNPGDLRVSKETCGDCHPQQVAAVPRSTMSTAAVFWAAVSYANGLISKKPGLLGESYNREGNPQILRPAVPPTPEQIAKGALPLVVPLPRWEIFQPGEYFRAFERGGLLNNTIPPEVGNPNPLLGDEAGKPDIRVSNRGRGTGSRVSPGLINLQKTRLNDPHLSFLGTNEHPGDYRSSGCTACHVVYANDRDPLHSGQWAKYGHVGLSQTGDKTIPKDEKGHPIKHQFTRAVPTSQCMSCHMHQPNSFVNTYLGYLMWDYESDGELMWPKEQKYPTPDERRKSLDHNPEGAAVRGLWTDIDFLERVSSLNPQAKNTQFADYHGHGWNFMAVFKRDKKGNFLDANDTIVSKDDPEKFKKAVHLRDIHLERGMHCSDCHFSRDEHGDGQLYSEYGTNIEIECQDCHGRLDRNTNLRTSGPLAPPGGTDLRLGTTPFGQRRFIWSNGILYQRSMVNPGMEWVVRQVRDTVTRGHQHYNDKSHYAKTVQRGGAGWGNTSNVAHSEDKITCYACHSSWMTSCFGCHLPQEQNARSNALHYEGTETRNYASYNPQVLRTDVFMLGVNSPLKGAKIAPVRSSSALTLSSINPNRQRIYIQQAPISAPGYSSQAFNPHVPHTVRSKETQACSSCHISEANDNNAWLAQTYLQGTNFVNFVGRFAWVATGDDGFEAIAVTEWEEPQAVIGSYLHKLAYPDWYANHQKRKKELAEGYHHHGHAKMVQLRGEYLYAANGDRGFEAYDVANVDNKDFSERMISAPSSPIGQRTFIKSKYAAAFSLPTNMPIDPTRETTSIPENQEQPWHPLYRYAYIADKYEGLILVDVTTLTDGDPLNNFFTRALTWNPEDRLHGAQSIHVAGRWVYIGTEKGLAIVDVDQPLAPKLVAYMPEIKKATGIAVQFRYAFVTDGQAIHTINVTDPTRPRLTASLPLEEARNVYVARTYAYVAGGKQGVIIVDIERPEAPKIDQIYNADGELHDVYDVKVASTNASTYAYVADGEHGIKVLQLSSPEWGPNYAGFSPRPMPQLIAKRHTHGKAVSISKGMDRDRAVDESGNQVSIFNRIGSRPMTTPELQRLYMRDGRIYTVSDRPSTRPQGSTTVTENPATKPQVPVVQKPATKPVTR